MTENNAAQAAQSNWANGEAVAHERASLLDRAEALVVDAIKRMRAAHVGCQDLLMEAERFLQDRKALASASVAGKALVSQLEDLSKGGLVPEVKLRALVLADAAPQASEAVRILFPTHLRKMWSGGEVQAWLDTHQNVTAPKPSAKGSFGRYRQGQEQPSDLKKETVRRSQENSNER